LRLPHAKVRNLEFHAGAETLKLADFSGLPVRYPFIAIMPQWDFLDFVAKEAARFSGFNLMMQAEATGLIEEGGRIVGLRANEPGGEFEVRTDLVIAADGRRSVLREAAGLKVDVLGAPVDVLWFPLPRRDGDPHDVSGFLGKGEILVMIDRGETWQCGYVIAKGSDAALRAGPIADFRKRIAALVPAIATRVHAIKSWDDVKLLTVAVDRLVQWYRPGLLCIGDAAHAMSPVGGVGINLAIQDAVAAANLLWRPLSEGRVDVEHLRSVLHRRELPTRITQMMQVFVQNRIIGRVLRSEEPRAPLPMRIASRFPAVRRRFAKFVGLGVRPEHVASPRAKEPWDGVARH
jgi:2-polyprenyl-6-methoxyphenol hydroxylase-like FAD-dependent oxidoreductase